MGPQRIHTTSTDTLLAKNHRRQTGVKCVALSYCGQPAPPSRVRYNGLYCMHGSAKTWPVRHGRHLFDHSDWNLIRLVIVARTKNFHVSLCNKEAASKIFWRAKEKSSNTNPNANNNVSCSRAAGVTNGFRTTTILVPATFASRIGRRSDEVRSPATRYN